MKKLLLLSMLLFSTGAFAQFLTFGNTPPAPLGAAVIPNTCYAPLAVTSASSSIPLPCASPPYSVLTIRNSGSEDAYFALGASTVTASLSNIVLRAGKSIALQATDNYIAAVTPTSTTTLDVYQGTAAALLGN